MIKLSYQKIKRSGGPGIFFHRLLDYMQSHQMVRLVNSDADIHLATVWLDNPPKNIPIVYRAAACYYDTKQQKRHSLNLRIRNTLSKSDFIIYQSQFGKRLCEKVLNVEPENSSIIYNGFDATKCVDITPYKSNHNSVYVACADWSNPAKRGKEIIRSFNKANLYSSELIMIGPGSENWMGKHANVRCIGRKKHEEIISYLKAADVFIHMGFAEVCPNSVVEALNLGCFVICNNTGGTKELLSEQNGLVVECDSKFRFKRHDANLSLDTDLVAQALRDSTGKKFLLESDCSGMYNCASRYLEVFKKMVLS